MQPLATLDLAFVPPTATDQERDAFLSRPYDGPESFMDFWTFTRHRAVLDFTEFEVDLELRNDPHILADFTCDHIDCTREARYAMWDGCFCLEHA